MAPRTLARSRIRQSPGWAHPAWYRGGVFSPVFFADGGGDPVVGAEPEPDDEPTDDPADDWEPPSREAFEKLLADKKKADGEAATRRKYLRQHGIDPKTGQKAQADPEPDDEPAAVKDAPAAGPSAAEIRRQVEKAAAEAELRGMRKTKTLVTGVNSALSEAGWNGTRLGSLMKLVDLDEVDIDDDGEITGLTEQIDQVKTDFPELFKRTRTPAGSSNSGGASGQNGAPAVKVDTADKPAPKKEPEDWSSQLAKRALRS